MITLSLYHIVGAAIVNFIIGSAWYHHKAFGTMWMRLSNISPETAEATRKRIGISMLSAFVASLVMAYVLTYLAAAWGVSDVWGAVQLGFWVWLGFIAPSFLNTVLWEGKSLTLYFINTLYWLVGLIAMAIVLVL